MRIAGIREVRERSSALLGGREPVLVTRHGRISGLYVPLGEPNRIPGDIRAALAETLGDHFERILKRKGVTEADVLKDFDAHRRRRR